MVGKKIDCFDQIKEYLSESQKLREKAIRCRVEEQECLSGTHYLEQKIKTLLEKLQAEIALEQSKNRKSSLKLVDTACMTDPVVIEAKVAESKDDVKPNSVEPIAETADKIVADLTKTPKKKATKAKKDAAHSIDKQSVPEAGAKMDKDSPEQEPQVKPPTSIKPEPKVAKVAPALEVKMDLDEEKSNIDIVVPGTPQQSGNAALNTPKQSAKKDLKKANAFNLFIREIKENKKPYDHKQALETWKNMPTELRDVYRKKAKTENDEHHEEFALSSGVAIARPTVDTKISEPTEAAMVTPNAPPEVEYLPNSVNSTPTSRGSKKRPSHDDSATAVIPQQSAALVENAQKPKKIRAVKPKNKKTAPDAKENVAFVYPETKDTLGALISVDDDLLNMLYKKN